MNDTTCIWPPYSQAAQWVDFIDSLDQHRPGLAAALRCILFTGLLGQGLCFRHLPEASRLVRVPTVIANPMRALRRNVLRELGQEIEWLQDLEVARHSRFACRLPSGRGSPGDRMLS